MTEAVSFALGGKPLHVRLCGWPQGDEALLHSNYPKKSYPIPEDRSSSICSVEKKKNTHSHFTFTSV